MSNPARNTASAHRDLLDVIESTFNEDERRRAITDLAKAGTPEACRILLDTLDACMWRTTKIALIHALGEIDQPRGTERLFCLAHSDADLGLAVEALRALGRSRSSVVGRFLLNLASDSEHPLQGEAVSALGNMPFFPCERELIALLYRNLESATQQDVSTRCALALARRGALEAWPPIKAVLMEEDTPESVVIKAVAVSTSIPCDEALEILDLIRDSGRAIPTELLRLADDTIRRQINQAPEDLAAELVKTTDTHTAHRLILRIASLPLDEAVTVAHLVSGSVNPHLEALIRTKLASEHSLESDLDFVRSQGPKIDHVALATLVGAHLSELGPQAASRFLNLVDTHERISLLASLPFPDAIQRLHDHVCDAALVVSTRIEAVNSIVAQGQAAAPNSTLRRDCVASLERALDEIREPQILARVIRALGQIDAGKPSLIAHLATLLIDQTERVIVASVYHALGAMTDPASTQTLLDRSEAVLEPREFEDLVSALAARGKLPRVPDFSPEQAMSTKRSRLAWLRVLTHNGLSSHCDLITNLLASDDYQTLVLAIAAAKKNLSEGSLAKLLELAHHPNVSISGRALDGLCASGNVVSHLYLVSSLDDLPGGRGQALQVLRGIKPRPGSDYGPVQQKLDTLLFARAGLFEQSDICTAAMNLRDNLHTRASSAEHVRLTPAISSKAAHESEKFLHQNLADYEMLSDTVKSALINAEVTYQNPALFDQRVDKSTLVIEYVKAIDLLLQDRIGSQIFFDSDGEVLRRMQSRVAQLRLDDELVPPLQRVRELGCGSHFGPSDLPSYKLTSLARAIGTGRVQHDPYRIVDGLRAWGLIMLLFGRTYWFRHTEIHPVFQLASSDNSLVCDLVVQLFALQDARNQAAHRGTILNHHPLTQTRTECVTAFNLLQRITGNIG